MEHKQSIPRLPYTACGMDQKKNIWTTESSLISLFKWKDFPITNQLFSQKREANYSTNEEVKAILTPSLQTTAKETD